MTRQSILVEDNKKPVKPKADDPTAVGTSQFADAVIAQLQK